MQNSIESQNPARPIHLFGSVIVGALAGAVIGAITNSINGAISPLYFVNVLGWQNVDNVLHVSIIQGIVEGLIFGAILSLIFTSVVRFVSKNSCPHSVGVRYLLGIMGAALCCWVLGGLIAMSLATVNADFYRKVIIGVPRDTNEMLRYAWVGGSIVGIQVGGFVCVILASLLFRARWLRQAWVTRTSTR